MVSSETLDTVSYLTPIEAVAVFFAVSTQYTNVTDGQTLHDGISRSYTEQEVKVI